MTSPAQRNAARFPTIPTGEVVGSFGTYERAQAAVDQLARADFPLGEITIVGSNLKSVERVTGKMNAGRAALNGLLSGIVLGIFVGLLVMILTPEAGLATLLPVVMVAIGFSVIWSLLTHIMNPRKKEFTSVMQVLAAHFDVVVSPQLAGRARQALGTLGQGLGAAQQPVVGHSAPAHPSAVQQAAGHAPVERAPVSAANPSASAAGAGAPDAAVQPGANGAQGETGSPDVPDAADQEPAAPPRTYGEAQDALRREREDRAREARRP
ncbi:MAG: general stress protein, partial [Pseudoclavibacter sp.]